ncbi:MAG: hypothetical protein M0R76_01720 [Proteobacteria bacterium]|nr:hypothetical protein [Pseudomonadota bacterium]
MHGLRSAIGLDIGSNTFAACLLQRNAAGQFSVLRDTSLPVRLSEGVTRDGRLSETAMARGLAGLRELRDTFDMARVPVKAVGTAVLRMASNAAAFTEPAGRILGHPIDIIDAKTEAQYSSRGALLDMPDFAGAAVLDVGGQSTELSLRPDDDAWAFLSLPLGVVRLTERVSGGERLTTARIDAMRGLVRDALAEAAFPFSPRSVPRLVGVGGTATTLGRLEQGLETFDRDRIHRLALERDTVRRWLYRMAALATEERMARTGLRAQRADVFPAGIAIILEMLDFLGLQRFVVSTYGLRVGVAISLLSP